MSLSVGPEPLPDVDIGQTRACEAQQRASGMLLRLQTSTTVRHLTGLTRFQIGTGEPD